MNTLSEINTELPEGKLLMAAIGKITGTYERDKTPDEIIEMLNQLAEHIYQEQ